MKAVTKKIVLLVSISSVVIGCTLIVFQSGIIPKDFGLFLSTLINFWPVSLLIAGAIFLRDSFLRRRYLQQHAAVEKTLALPVRSPSREVNLDLSFSYGSLSVAPAGNDVPMLRYEQFGPMPDPVVESTSIGHTAIVKLHKPKSYLSPHFRLRNAWRLSLAKNICHNLSLSLHEADLVLDLRDLLVEKISLRADTGRHSLHFPVRREKIEGDIYSSSDRLELVVPDESFLRLKLLNPFCQVDFPQGDFEKQEDGAIISNPEKTDFGLIELTVDGPLKELVIDIE